MDENSDDRYCMTVKEAAKYACIGRDRLYRMIEEDPTLDFVLRKGKQFLVKRKKFEEWLDKAVFI